MVDHVQLNTWYVLCTNLYTKFPKGVVISWMPRFDQLTSPLKLTQGYIEIGYIILLGYM